MRNFIAGFIIAGLLYEIMLLKDDVEELYAQIALVQQTGEGSSAD